MLMGNQDAAADDGGGGEELSGPDITVLTRGVAHVVLPAFNEEASLPPLLTRLAAVARTEHLVVWVIDDGSTDDTAAVAERGAPGLEIKVVPHPVNLGLSCGPTGIRSRRRCDWR